MPPVEQDFVHGNVGQSVCWCRYCGSKCIQVGSNGPEKAVPVLEALGDSFPHLCFRITPINIVNPWFDRWEHVVQIKRSSVGVVNQVMVDRPIGKSSFGVAIGGLNAIKEERHEYFLSPSPPTKSNTSVIGNKASPRKENPKAAHNKKSSLKEQLVQHGGTAQRDSTKGQQD